jgi:DNA recombination protein RmuC
MPSEPIILAAAVSALIAVLLTTLIFLLLRRRVGLRSSPEDGGMDGFAETSRRLEAMSERIGELTNLFLVPRTRGVVGETVLQELLSSWLPPSAYRMQYAFRSGARADAVVFFADKRIAIDAKFPLESVQRLMHGGATESAKAGEMRSAFLRHADAIAERYVRPDEGTLDFALMYIPSEAVYHFAFVQHAPELLGELQERGVVPVSPGTLFLYIQTAAHAIRGLSLPEGKKELAAQLDTVTRELQDFSRLFYRAGTHMKNMVKTMDDAESRLNAVERSVRRLKMPDDRDA